MSEKKNILISDRFAQEAYVTLENQNYLNVRKAKSFDLVGEDLQDVNALIIRSRTKITDEVFKRAKNLQVIVTATSGFDHIDLNAAAKWGITVMYTPDANVESAAQLTWALALACANKILPSTKAVKMGEWNRDSLLGMELSRKTYGIIGLGRIGKRVAEIANCFNMNVIAYDPYCDEQNFKDAEAERVAYEEVLKRSDIASFHVPATAETFHMLKRNHLEFMNHGIILLNTCRGNVFIENDLCEGIEKGWIGALGLDVFEKEPLPRYSNLLNYSNVVLTPHIGANTSEAFQKASEQAAFKVLRFFVDSSTSDTLPPKAGWYGAQPPFSS